MPAITPPLRSLLARSRFHRPALAAKSAVRRFRYARIGNGRSSSFHEPTVFCIGAFKTGTVSLASLLGQRLDGAHEPDAHLFAREWLRRAHDEIGPEAWSDFLARRANTLKLDFEASGFLTLEAPLLARLFPSSKFILTVRDPHPWLASLLGHILQNRERLRHHYWEPVFAIWFGKTNFAAEDRELRERNLFPLKGLLEHWLLANRTALDSIPQERLLVIPTHRMSDSTEQIARFLDLPSGAFAAGTPHLNRAAPDDTRPPPEIDSRRVDRILEQLDYRPETFFGRPCNDGGSE